MRTMMANNSKIIGRCQKNKDRKKVSNKYSEWNSPNKKKNGVSDISLPPSNMEKSQSNCPKALPSPNKAGVDAVFVHFLRDWGQERQCLLSNKIIPQNTKQT